MVHARLHVICGNCGSTDVFYKRGEVYEEEGHTQDMSCLACDNCATLHFLSEREHPSKGD